jgi:hypothetical protein
MATSKGGTQKLSNKFRLLTPTDMTTHWKALEEHFLMLPRCVCTILGVSSKISCKAPGDQIQSKELH